MLSAIMPGLRSLRGALITGSLLTASLYVLLWDLLDTTVDVQPAVASILAMTEHMPLLISLLIAAVIGGLYMSTLEGVVDSVHKRSLNETQPRMLKLLRRTLSYVDPLSESARGRIEIEAKRFYHEKGQQKGAIVPTRIEAQDEVAFVRDVVAEVLWLEGKLAGSVLETTYDQYRSEGELRLGSGLLLPLLGVAVINGLNISGWAAIAVATTTILIGYRLVNDGLYYYRKAHSLLAHHIADGHLLTPSMETLQRSRITEK